MKVKDQTLIKVQGIELPLMKQALLKAWLRPLWLFFRENSSRAPKSMRI